MLPKRYRVKSKIQETEDTFTLALEPLEEPIAPFLPGQFNMLYLFGFGEVPISMSGSFSSKNELVHTIRAVGGITEGMGRLSHGDEVGVRGPFGSAWPLGGWTGNLFVIAGGLGLAPLRPVLQERKENITLLYGSRTPSDLLYLQELEEWKKEGVRVDVSVDRPDAAWRGHVGVITALIQKRMPDPKKTRVFLCGPEIMMKFALIEILRFEIGEQDIFLSMERNMKCATGFCGHCQYGPYFLCKDGPIFSYGQIKKWLPIQEL